MTKNKAQKRAARALKDATGRSYTGAAREVAFGLNPTTGVVSARRYAQALTEEFQRIGWNSSYNAGMNDMDGTPWVFCGPAEVLVGRVSSDGSELIGGNPDDAAEFDQTSAPRVYVATPPNAQQDDDGAIEETYSVANLSPAQMVSSIKALVARSRAAGLATKHVRARCYRCDEIFPEHHLLWVGKREAYCPGCVFQPEEGYVCVPVAGLMEFYTDLEMTDSSYSTMWTALAVMTAQAIARSPREAVDIMGGSALSVLDYRPPATYWMWLPQHPQAPAALAQFGAGATIGAIVAALDEAFPDLRGRYAEAIKPFIDDAYYDPDDPHNAWLVPAATWVRDYWETIVAFAIGFLMTPESEGLVPDEDWADVLFTESFYEDYWMKFRVSSEGLHYALGMAHRLVEMIAPGFPVTPGITD